MISGRLDVGGWGGGGGGGGCRGGGPSQGARCLFYNRPRCPEGDAGRLTKGMNVDLDNACRMLDPVNPLDPLQYELRKDWLELCFKLGCEVAA